jgi:hypothetical protein
MVVERDEKTRVFSSGDTLLNRVHGLVRSKMFNIYLSSFSPEGDMLSQWRANADDGTGFSIGFRAELPKATSRTKGLMSVVDGTAAEARKRGLLCASRIGKSTKRIKTKPREGIWFLPAP